jgi:hypothetical protein
MNAIRFVRGRACGMVPDQSDCTNTGENDSNRFELMQGKLMIKGVKLVAILLVAGVWVLAHMHTTVGAQEQPARLFEIVGMSVPLEQRVGVDDGAAFVVHFAGDTRGTLDACG